MEKMELLDTKNRLEEPGSKNDFEHPEEKCPPGRQLPTRTAVSSSDSGSSCDANLQLAGEHRSSVSPKVEGDCVLYQHSKTRTIHMMPKGSSERKFVCGRSATADHKVFMSIVYTPNMRCKQCLNGRPLRDVGALNEALQSALKRQRSAGK